VGGGNTVAAPIPDYVEALHALVLKNLRATIDAERQLQEARKVHEQHPTDGTLAAVSAAQARWQESLWEHEDAEVAYNAVKRPRSPTSPVVTALGRPRTALEIHQEAEARYLAGQRAGRGPGDLIASFCDIHSPFHPKRLEIDAAWHAEKTAKLTATPHMHRLAGELRSEAERAARHGRALGVLIVAVATFVGIVYVGRVAVLAVQDALRVGPIVAAMIVVGFVALVSLALRGR